MSGSSRITKQVPAMVEFTEDADRPPLGLRTSEQLSADDADLRAGIGNLAGLVADHRRLPELLAEVAAFAVGAIPGGRRCWGDVAECRSGGQHGRGVGGQRSLCRRD